MNLIRSEFMKIRSTNVWWIFTIAIFASTVLMSLFWMFLFVNQEIDSTQHPQMMQRPDGSMEQLPPGDIHRILIAGATQIYTSGQYFVLLFIMILGIILMTNEFFHQTATATFLTTPKRTKVILAKFAAIGIFSVLFWIGTTAVVLGIGSLYFSSKGYGLQLGEWEVQRSILMNLLTYVLWGILGVGLGVLLRSQIGSVVTGTIAYLIGTTAVQIVATIVYTNWIKEAWVFKATVAWPAVASSVMTQPDSFPGRQEAGFEAPQWWAGLLVLIGYGVLFGAIGTMITRKRDIA